MKKLLDFYRMLPIFRSKLRLGKLIFKRFINQDEPIVFKAHHGLRYSIPNTMESLGNELLITGMYEKHVVIFLQNRVAAGDMFFDIGANIGSIGIPVVKKRKDITYFGFEASPSIFSYLNKNFSLNGLGAASLYNFVVHESDGNSMKFYETVLYGKSSLASNYSTAFTMVPSISIDGFCSENGIGKIDWVKVDVQGFELFVFKGMKHLLANGSIRNILFEFEYWAEADAGLEKGAAQQYLVDSGYQLFDMNGQQLPAILTDGRAMIWAKRIIN